ncbi:MAG: hypothetical protein H0U71_06460 [Gammaproteobacteria bacterium]|nr:hypothetical protein [Gammaproteobacteria bacterium]
MKPTHIKPPSKQVIAIGILNSKTHLAWDYSSESALFVKIPPGGQLDDVNNFLKENDVEFQTKQHRGLVNIVIPPSQIEKIKNLEDVEPIAQSGPKP